MRIEFEAKMDDERIRSIRRILQEEMNEDSAPPGICPAGQKCGDGVPSVFIPSEAVKDIKADKFERLAEKFEAIVVKMAEDKKMLQEKMNEDRERYEKVIEAMSNR